MCRMMTTRIRQRRLRHRWGAQGGIRCRSSSPSLNYMVGGSWEEGGQEQYPCHEQEARRVEEKCPLDGEPRSIKSPAPLAPELAMKEDLHGKEREKKKLKSDKKASAFRARRCFNDLREKWCLQNKPQAAVLEAIPKVAESQCWGREDLMTTLHNGEEWRHRTRSGPNYSARSRANRDQRRWLNWGNLQKFGKKVQIEVQQKRQKEKKDMIGWNGKVQEGSRRQSDFWWWR